MENIKNKMFKKSLIFIAYLIIVYLFRQYIFKTNYTESMVILHFTIIASFLFTFINDVLRDFIYKDKMGVGFTKALIVLLINAFALYGIYLFVSNLYKPDNWVRYTYDNTLQGIWEELKDFVFLFKTYNLSFKRDLIIETVITAVMMIFAIPSKLDYQDTKEINSFDYITRLIAKFYLKYSFFIILIVLICIKPNQYVYIATLTYFIIAIAVIVGIVNYVRYIKSIEEIKNIKGKKLVLLVTLDNFEENMIVQKNVLNEFKKYRSNQSFNNMIIDSPKCCISRYEMLYYNYINTRQFEDIYYLIYVDNIQMRNIQKETIKRFKKCISDIKEGNEKVVIVGIDDYSEKNTLSKELKEEYRDDYRINVFPDEALEDLLEKEENTELKKSVEKLLDDINSLQKKKAKVANSYIINSLINMETSDAIRSFYVLTKICEYIIQHRALKRVSQGKVTPTVDKILHTSMGSWKELQRIEEPKIIQDNYKIMQAVQNLKKDLDIKMDFACNYNGAVEFINHIRNKTIGHGVVTYMVAKKIVNNFETITEILIREFIRAEYILDETDYIRNIFPNNVPCIKIIDDKLYMYSYGEMWQDGSYHFEYLNFDTGKILVENKAKKIKLNYKK